MHIALRSTILKAFCLSHIKVFLKIICLKITHVLKTNPNQKFSHPAE